MNGFPHQTNLRFSSVWPQKELLDLSTIDVILISNYHCMMALPYITERTGFTGTVYATEPTLQIGRYEDTRHGNIIILVLKGDKKVNANVKLNCPFWTNDDIGGTLQMSEMLRFFTQIVDGGVGELHGESSQSSVCHLLEK